MSGENTNQIPLSFTLEESGSSKGKRRKHENLLMYINFSYVNGEHKQLILKYVHW